MLSKIIRWVKKNLLGLPQKRILSEEHRKNLSKSCKGKKAWNKGLTKETNKSVMKISKTLTGRKKGFIEKRNFLKAHKNRIFTTEMRRIIGNAKLGDKNHMWKGDKVGYFALHVWINRHKTKSNYCEFCSREGYTELGNVSGEYKRDVNDFMWVCKDCNRNMNSGVINIKMINEKIGKIVADKRNFKNSKKNVCKYCNCNNPLIMTIEHSIPLSRGGEDNEKNKECVCWVCNQLKGALKPKEFKVYIKTLINLYNLHKVNIIFNKFNINFNPNYYPTNTKNKPKTNINLFEKEIEEK